MRRKLLDLLENDERAYIQQHKGTAADQKLNPALAVFQEVSSDGRIVFLTDPNWTTGENT